MPFNPAALAFWKISDQVQALVNAKDAILRLQEYALRRCLIQEFEWRMSSRPIEPGKCIRRLCGEREYECWQSAMLGLQGNE